MPSLRAACRFKTPEGRYDLVAERNQNTAVFHYQRCTRLCLATLQLGTAEDGQYLLYNVGEFVYINRATNIHKVRARQVAEVCLACWAQLCPLQSLGHSTGSQCPSSAVHRQLRDKRNVKDGSEASRV